MDDDLPIALRRTRRTSARRPEPSPEPLAARTPRSKRVRFSDPGPISSGLTPSLRRTTLTTPRRRQSGPTPSRTRDPSPTELTFLPLRQVLSGRVTRRLRRNGLSEEMNAITAEKRRQARERSDELESLRSQLRDKDLEVYRLQNETIVVDTERVWDLERQVADLRRELDDKSMLSVGSPGLGEWTRAARDPFADELTADNFGDATMAEIQCSTPTRARASFPTPPLTSPLAPATPRYVETPVVDVGVQTSFRDEEKEGLEEEVASLQLEMGKLSSTLEGYASLVGRLSQRLEGHGTPDEGGFEDELESRIEGLFRELSDRTAALLDLTSSLSSLGFPGDDAPSIIASLSSGFRAARLELEYLSPGESTLPLTSRGAEVLDLLLARLRDLARRAREDEASIDEYHELEQSLRKQLSARVEVMDSLRAELEKARGEAAESGKRVDELEISVSRLRGAVDGYVRDMGELETLVERLEGAAEAAEAKAGRIPRLEEELQGSKSREEDLRSQVASLETKLADGVRLTQKLRVDVSTLVVSRSNLNVQHGAALALRDARVTELRAEIDRLNESLRAAHSTIQTLRVDNHHLEGRLTEERGRARGAIEGMKGELQRVLRMSEEFFDADSKREGQELARGERSAKRMRIGGLMSGGFARRSSRRKRDSGLGLLDEDEAETGEAAI